VVEAGQQNTQTIPVLASNVGKWVIGRESALTILKETLAAVITTVHMMRH